MPFIKLSLLISLALAASLASASSSPEAEPAAEGEAPKTITKDQREFMEKQTQLNGLTSRIEEAEKRFQLLVHEKEHAHSVEEKQHIIREMVTISNQRNKDVLDYNRIKQELTYRYPNKGEHLNRHYQTQTKKSVEEMENAAGLDELLTRTKKVIEKKFAPLLTEEQREQAEAKAKVRAEKEEEPKSKKLRLEK